VGFSVYRIVQQALTNTLAHGGLGAKAAKDDAHRGRGLIGMRERVALFGGELKAGPRPEGGFAVHASIPLEGRA
jgi:signal transduction histidine kinase